MTCGTDLGKWSATSALAGVDAESKPLVRKGIATTVGCHMAVTAGLRISGAGRRQSSSQVRNCRYGVRDRGCLPAEDA